MLKKIHERIRNEGLRGAIAAGLLTAARRLRANDNSSSIINSPYLSWLRLAVPGMLLDGNIIAIEHAIRNLPADAAVIEIGTFSGLSTAVIAHFLDKYDQNPDFYTCDRWEFEGQQLGECLGASRFVTHDEYRDYVKGNFLRTAETFVKGRSLHTIEVFSDEFFGLWFRRETVTSVFGRQVRLGGPIGFCYIDGNHTYDFARRDFENTDRFLVAGGHILFDDSADGSIWEVNQLVREVVRTKQYELVMRNPNYLLKKR